MPFAEKDQHFCVDEEVLDTIIKTAGITKEDCILEIGAGSGNLTAKLAKKAGKVIALEIDQRFKEVLEKIARNVEVIIGNALHAARKRRDFTKVVANIPYQLCEAVMHLLCRARHVKAAVLMVPRSFAGKIKKHPIFSAFFSFTIVMDVPAESFVPKPDVSSQVILVEPLVKMRDEQFIIQKLYRQREKKVYNGLRDTLIDLYKRKREEPLTKKNAKKLLEQGDFSSPLMEMKIAQLIPSQYPEISKKIQQLMKRKEGN